MSSLFDALSALVLSKCVRYVTPEDFLNGRMDSTDFPITEIVQGPDSDLSISVEDGDVFFDFHASLKDMSCGRLVDMILPGDRYVSFEIKDSFQSRAPIRFPGMGIRPTPDAPPGDLYVQPVLALPTRFDESFLDSVGSIASARVILKSIRHLA